MSTTRQYATRRKAKKPYKPVIQFDLLQEEKEREKQQATLGAEVTDSGFVQIRTPSTKAGEEDFFGPYGVSTREKPVDDRSFTFDTIELGETLGSGAYGSVLKTVHTSDPQTFYATKVVRLDQNAQKPKSIISEFRSLQGVNCPFIIKLHEVLYRESMVYFIMEYMDQGAFSDGLKSYGPFPEFVLSVFMKQILVALQFLHTTKKMIHRDLKPANLLFNSQGAAKLADFGMAGLNTNLDKNIWQTVQGTEVYMCPQRLSAENHSFASDIWSLGITVLECALGHFPLPLADFNVYEMKYIFERAFSESEHFLKSLVPESSHLSAELNSFASACLQYDPEKRSTAEQLLQMEFITKYNDNDDQASQRVIDWIKNEYEPKRKQKELTAGDTLLFERN